jgi:hypothetical protein
MIVNLLVIKTRITWPSGTYIKERADILTKATEVQSDAEHTNRLSNTGIAGKDLSFRSPSIIFDTER